MAHAVRQGPSLLCEPKGLSGHLACEILGGEHFVYRADVAGVRDQQPCKFVMLRATGKGERIFRHPLAISVAHETSDSGLDPHCGLRRLGVAFSAHSIVPASF